MKLFRRSTTRNRPPTFLASACYPCTKNKLSYDCRITIHFSPYAFPLQIWYSPFRYWILHLANNNNSSLHNNDRFFRIAYSDWLFHTPKHRSDGEPIRRSELGTACYVQTPQDRSHLPLERCIDKLTFYFTLIGGSLRFRIAVHTFNGDGKSVLWPNFNPS
jgi:hypothetical protein